MEQMERITYMEKLLDEATAVISALSEALEKYNAIQSVLQELSAYYGSEQWNRDFDDDNAGKLPDDLKRGVLSEDAVYNLLADNRELIEQLRRLAVE